MRFLKRSGGASFRLPALRFRAKIMLGFAVVLAISAGSMGFAYLGFERVSGVVDTYRRGVLEADLSRDIDEAREDERRRRADEERKLRDRRHWRTVEWAPPEQRGVLAIARVRR